MLQTLFADSAWLIVLCGLLVAISFACIGAAYMLKQIHKALEKLINGDDSA